MARRGLAGCLLGGVAMLAAGTALAGSNVGKLGSTLVVKGQTKDVIAVTAIKIQDPALGYQASRGKRVVGITFKVKNVGKVKYKDFPNARLTTVGGVSSGSAISAGGSCDSPGILNLQPGQATIFCLPFQVAKSAKLKSVQYETDGGYGTPALFKLR